MGRTVIVVYRPKKGKEAKLKEVLKDHLPLLRRQGLATERKSIVMQATDRSVVEVFEWKSAQAIEDAHTNPEVGKLWDRFSEVCDFDQPMNVKEFKEMFSEFETIEIE
jgi:hypothetical protein